MSVEPRLRRLFAADGRCFDVAVDHGFFGESRFLAGIEDLAGALDLLVEAAPDAIQLSPGSAPLLQRRPGPKPALVLRTDVANVYGPTVDPETRYFSELVPEAVEQAVRLDAACVVVNLLWIDGQEDLHRACVHNVAALKARCEPAGMPLMVEPLAMRPGSAGYGVDGDPERIRALVRQAVGARRRRHQGRPHGRSRRLSRGDRGGGPRPGSGARRRPRLRRGGAAVAPRR